MLKTRIISAVIGIPIILGILYLGGIYWHGFFLLLGLLAVYEIYKMMELKMEVSLKIPGYALLALLILSSGYAVDTLLVAFLIVVLAVAWSVIKYPQITIKEISMSLLAPVYIGFLLSYAIKISFFTQGFFIMLLALVLTWASDVGGFTCGKLWGRRKLAPLLSPAKTWAGSLGSLAFSVIVAGLYFFVVDIGFINIAYLLILGVVASLMGQLGDLFISGIKRYFGAKDSGYIIPGHGGVLDRFDSFLLVVPWVYYFYIYLVVPFG